MWFDNWRIKRLLKKELEGCNYEMAKFLLEKNLSGGGYPKEMIRLVEKFTSNPCANTAIGLLKYEIKFMSVFELSKQGGFTERLLGRDDLK